MLDKEEHRKRQQEPKSPSPRPKRKKTESSDTEHDDEEGQRKRPGSPPTGRNENSDTEDSSSAEDGSNRKTKTKEPRSEKRGPLGPTPGTSEAFYKEVFGNPEETNPEHHMYDIQTLGPGGRADTGTPEPWDEDEGPDENVTPKAHQPSDNVTSLPGVPSPLRSESVPKAQHRVRPNTEGINHMLTEKRAPVGETRITKDPAKARKVLVSSGSLPQDVTAPVAESIALLHDRERTMGPLARAGSSRQHIEDHASTSLRLMNLHKQTDLLSGNLETLKTEVGTGSIQICFGIFVESHIYCADFFTSLQENEMRTMQNDYLSNTRTSLNSFMDRSLLKSEKDELLRALEGSIKNTRKLYEYIILLQGIVKDKSIHEAYQASVIFDQQERINNVAGQF